MSTAQRLALATALRNGSTLLDPQPIARQRTDFAAFMATFPIPADVTRTPTELGGRPALLVEPTGPATPGTILYLHGGSNLVGSPETALVLAAELVRRTGVRAISLDYRLAPEHPFPAGIDDCLAAYRDLLDDGVDPASVVFAGDSAGGGHTVTTCLVARDAGLPLPAAIVAFSPGVDHTRSGASMVSKDGIDPFFHQDDLRASGELYLAGQDPHQALLAPAVYADLTGFPPMLLQVGTDELLLDDSVRLAARAVDAGVDVILDVTAGVPHVFPAFVGTLDEAGEAFDRAALFVTQRLGAGSTLEVAGADA